ncbi:MAG: hypothetical protein EA379_03525 [Phycisphaerales bacterium]|nr:MAG: hypothetical protein EA379_03525 [Phycisphaerales bacterium]
MITRKIGKLLRGKSTPFQIVLACVLGSMMGFVPGFVQGPGLFLFLLLVLIVLNANLFVATITGAVAKLASLALMPVSFGVGRVLLDGPTQPLFKAMINAPVLALFGFERYATTGGMVVGLVFGLLCGVGLVAVVTGFRRKMATMEQGSEKYRVYTSKWWVKALVFVFIGGKKGKRSYEDLLQKKVGNPVRPIGVVFALLLVGLIIVVQGFLREPIVTAALQRGLERANGATVDLRSASLSLREGRMTVEGLAMADPNALETDLFRADRVELAISGADLLRKRLTIDRVEAIEASSGEARRIRGVIVGRAPEPREPPPAREDEKTLEDYFEDARVWKERLAQARRWIERASGGEDAAGAPTRETLRERLAREVESRGYARVVASHLVEGSPTLLVREIVAEGVRVAAIEGDPLDVRAQNVSTSPRLVEGAPRVHVKSRSGDIDVTVALGAASATPGGRNDLSLALRNLSVDKVASGMRIGGQRPVRGGTVSVAASGVWDAGAIDMPLQLTLNNSEVSMPGVGASTVNNLTFPVSLRGPLDNPRIGVDDKGFADALVKAGARELGNRLGAEAERRLGDVVGDRAGEAGRALRGLLGGSRNDRDAEKKDDE